MRHRGTIVVVTDRLLHPGHSGGAARIRQLVSNLRACGYRVVLVGRHAGSVLGALRTRLLVDRVLFVHAAPFMQGTLQDFDVAPFLPAVEHAVRRYRPLAVIAEYVWMAPCLDRVGGSALKLIDTLDLMHVRQQLYGGVEQGAWLVCTREEEAALLRKADVVMAIQRTEAEAFRQMAPETCVICVPHGMPVRERPLLDRRRDDAVVFVGSRNRSNLLGVAAFVEHAWPLVRRVRPTAELHVYGMIADEPFPDAPGVVRRGPIRRVGDAYRQAKVVINPVPVGTGLKIKTVEALAHGRAVVTTSWGADGMLEGAGRAFVLEDGMSSFAAAVARLLGSDAERRVLETSAREFARVTFGPRASCHELRALLEQVATGRTMGAVAIREGAHA